MLCEYFGRVVVWINGETHQSDLIPIGSLFEFVFRFGHLQRDHRARALATRKHKVRDPYLAHELVRGEGVASLVGEHETGQLDQRVRLVALLSVR